MRTLEEIKRTVETGLGRFPCDLKLANVQLVNVFSGEIYPTDIYIQNKRVVSIEPGLTLEAEKNVDCGGAYAVPGFIDSHMHFESTMLSPEALATVVVPQGTTTLCADLMEIANVAGEEGLRAMLTCMDRLPYRMLIEVSSRVPTAPGLETTGAELGSQQVAEIMDWPESISLGELDPSKILFVKEEYLQKIASYINTKISEAEELDSFKHLTPDMRAILTELNIADDYFKAKAQVEKLELDLEAKEREIYNLKHDLISNQVQTETNTQRIEELEAENKELLLNKTKLEAALEDSLLGKVTSAKTDKKEEKETT